MAEESICCQHLESNLIEVTQRTATCGKHFVSFSVSGARISWNVKWNDSEKHTNVLSTSFNVSKALPPPTHHYSLRLALMHFQANT